ncbi:peroxisomal membrane anchor protein conserved region-domain-containing protein [Thelonectria olida]|uniref:Peroxisomal membrane protein PEX14 n=1 Tax=Thelonectria olida TaxID=1576542 RepID=A0A9P8W2A8_9HYPO|nr:peroxisomal membrane anchor protein conserved region-domain-containing protein [Thelonectria olida]
MAIREDLVASAAQFLQDPSVASSSVENRLSFLRSKNLTQEEIDAAMARAGGSAPPAPSAPYPTASPAGPPVPQQYYQPYPPQAWQPQPPPRRDWRDWFIMATVVSGVSYGLYSLGKRYVYPLVAPPTPEKLEQDKKSIEDQFERAFSLVEQLAKDTEDLKKAEQERTEKLDNAITELETVMSDLKAANRRREDDSQRIRDEVQSLKDSMPKALDNQKQLTDTRLKEVNSELVSLKTLVTQRMAAPAPAPVSTPSYLRGSSGGNVTPAPSISAGPDTNGEKSVDAGGSSTPTTTASQPSRPTSSFSRASTSGLGASTGKASIPAWQMAMSKQNDTSSTVAKPEEPFTGSSSS